MWHTVGVVRIEESSAELIDSGFTFNLNLFPMHFPDKYENAFRLLLDEWDRCIVAAKTHEESVKASTRKDTSVDQDSPTSETQQNPTGQ